MRKPTQKTIKKIKNLKFYVLWEDFNKREIKPYNIIGERLAETMAKFIDNNYTFEEFKKELISYLKYHYWAKAEYEIMVGGLFDYEKNAIKISIWDQIEPNIDLLAVLIYY